MSQEKIPEKFYPHDQAEGLRRLVAEISSENSARQKQNSPLPESPEVKKIKERFKNIHKN